jgi:hypothetical protein
MSAPVYFKFESCCTGEVLYFQGPTDPNDAFWTSIFPVLPQVLVYDVLAPLPGSFGDNLGLISKSCYLVTVETVTPPPASSYPTLLPGWMNATDGRIECIVDDEPFSECKKCPCYLLMPCDGSLAPYTTNQDLSAYLYSVTGQSVVFFASDEFPEICVQVLLAPPNVQCPENPPSPLVYKEDCECPCECYTVIANSKDCYYVDCDGNFQNTGPLTGTLIDIPCASTTPWIVGNVPNSKFEITSIGPCVNGECPQPCYRLVDCDGIQDPIDTNKTSLGQYAILGQIVKIEGYPDTCWIVDSEGDCECAIDVTVFQFYEDCPTCKNPSKYKLTNCDDSGTIVYTSSDLSAYVGQVILRGECPGCWLVSTIDAIPSDTIVTVTAAYLNCTECAREYYELTDCTGFKDPIITYTDLSQYLGSVIKIKYCPETCWTVNATNDPTDAGIVIPEVEYEDCPECLLTFPCICTTVRNDSTTLKEYRYYDCNLDVQFFNLAPGAKSDRFCMRVWAIYFPETDYIETFGNCSEVTEDVWECPAIVYPRRSVQPGYNTPACTIAKYEKISCKSAEVYYKQVLYRRYGISNCCPEDTDKWLIKKELIDLDALRDPDYECTVVNPCCPNTSSHGHSSCGDSSCGCTPLIPCNSQ